MAAFNTLFSWHILVYTLTHSWCTPADTSASLLYALIIRLKLAGMFLERNHWWYLVYCECSLCYGSPLFSVIHFQVFIAIVFRLWSAELWHHLILLVAIHTLEKDIASIFRVRVNGVVMWSVEINFEDGDSMFLQNVGMHIQCYMMSHHRRP